MHTITTLIMDVLRFTLYDYQQEHLLSDQHEGLYLFLSTQIYSLIVLHPFFSFSYLLKQLLLEKCVVEKKIFDLYEAVCKYLFK